MISAAVCLDARPLRSSTGIGRYARSVIRGLLEQDAERQYTLLSWRRQSAEVGRLADGRGQILSAFPGRLFAQFERHALPIPARRFAIFHGTNYSVPRFMGARTIATFYDVSYKKFPEAYPAGVAEGFDRWVHKALGFVDRVVTLSRKAKEDLVAAYGLDERRVRVVYPSADFLNGSRPALAVDRTGPPFMLFVGEIGPRKNLINLLRAFARIGTRIPHSLVVVGPPGPLPGYAATVRDEVSRLGLGSRARFTGWLPETELAALYSAATAVLLPSLDEGFGYPLLDAMAHGKPVLTSNCASMPEVVEDAAILVNPLSVEEISDGLVTLATDDVLRSRLSEAGLGRVKQFTEEEMVREFWNLYSTLGV